MHHGNVCFYPPPKLFVQLLRFPHVKEASALLFGDIKGTDRLFKRAVRAKQMSVALIDDYRGEGGGYYGFE